MILERLRKGGDKIVKNTRYSSNKVTNVNANSLH